MRRTVLEEDTGDSPGQSSQQGNAAVVQQRQLQLSHWWPLPG